MSILLRRCCAPQGDKICSVMLEKGKCRGGVSDAPETTARLRAHMECAPTVRWASTLLYIHTKNTPPGSVVLRAGWLGCLFTSDQTHKAGQTEGERRDIGDGQQGGNQCHKVGD